MSKYILSTMASSVSYTFYGKAPEGAIPPIGRKIKIEGGAGLPSINKGFGEMTQDHQGVPMWTPAGVVTPISDEAYDALLNHVVFKKHLDAGLLRVIDHDITQNHGAVAKLTQNMAVDDFAPLNKDTVKSKVKVKTKLSDNDDDRV